MLYRVLCLALACAEPASAALAIVPQPPMMSQSYADDAILPSLLYGFRFSGQPELHPMSEAQGNAMWDASGMGCVDGGGWDEPFPAGKGDLRSPPFCIPQPCVAKLGEDELARDVYGRALQEGEYETYLRRLEETCGDVQASVADLDPLADLEALLALASPDWVSFVPADAALFAGYEQPSQDSSSDNRLSATPRATISPRQFKASVGPAPWAIRYYGVWWSRSDTRPTISWPADAFGTFNFSSRRSGGDIVSTVLPPVRIASSGPNFGPETPRGGGGTPHFDAPVDRPLPGNPGEKDGIDETPQPAPVPLPASWLLLAGALAALRLPRHRSGLPASTRS